MIAICWHPLAIHLFCLTIHWLLLDNILCSASVGYVFLIVFLTLGFWVKLMLHLWLDYPYLEPTGLFDGAPHAWDEVMWVNYMGLLGVWLGRSCLCRKSLR